MRRLCAVIVLVLAAASGLAAEAGSPAASGGAPRLSVDRTEIDLGDVPFGRRVRASFTLSNTGKAPLLIQEVSPVRALEGC